MLLIADLLIKEVFFGAENYLSSVNHFEGSIMSPDVFSKVDEWSEVGAKG